MGVFFKKIHMNSLKKKPTNEHPGQCPETSMDPRWGDPSMYIQIGCDIFRRTYKPDARGHQIPALQPWKRSQLKIDFEGNTSKMKEIRRFEGMGCFPCNTAEYQESVNGYYNMYCRLGWVPVCGSWSTIEQMLKHVFGAYYEFGLDYIQLLFQKPTQNLPILLLVSQDRNTGKTTFLNFLKEIFGPNMVFADNASLRSQFNNERAGRLITACDEAFLDKKEDSEKLKSISTAQFTYVEQKGKDRYEVANFCKFILASNNINDPVYIDPEEVRYWVLEVPRLTSDNPEILDAMKREIPAFLGFLEQRQLHVPSAQSRMWFNMQDLRTPALERIIQICRPSCELELAEALIDIMNELVVDKLEYTSSDLTKVLKSRMKDTKDVHRIICKVWHVPNAGNKLAYDFYNPSSRGFTRCYGRFYTFDRAFLARRVPNYTPTPAAPTADNGVTGKLFSSEKCGIEENIRK